MTIAVYKMDYQQLDNKQEKEFHIQIYCSYNDL